MDTLKWHNVTLKLMKDFEMQKFIPVYEPVLTHEVKKNVIECMESNWISSRGKFIDEFEEKFSLWTGSKYSASVSNGTVALHLALLALDVGAGDEVIVPTFTYVASVNAIAYVGATPVFVDSLPGSWQIDPMDIERKISKKTKAIMAVHLYGQPADMLKIMTIAKKYDLKVIEDAAEAFGSKIGNCHVGTYGDISTYSFYGNKTITTGEGGMVVTNNFDLDKRVRKLKGQGLAGTKEYWHDEIGYNYRMTNICAAIGVAQLNVADSILAKKRHIAELYKKLLLDLPLSFFWEISGTTSSFWMNCIKVDIPADRDILRDFLKKQGVETRPGFFPSHTMPMFIQYNKSEYPVALMLAASVINLPSSPAMSDDDVIYVVNVIKNFFKERSI